MKNKQSLLFNSKQSLPLRGKYFALLLIVVLAFVLRFYKLGEVPLGFHQDEVSQAYNSFSILKTGHDRYGQLLPILFRSFGSYQPPVYTYLTPIPIFLFGNTIFAARSTSAFFGVLTVIVSFLIVEILAKRKYRTQLALLTAFIVAISPWAIHFSRRVVEGNLGVFFFLFAFLLLLKSLKKIKLFIPACFILGISTHAYYSERLLAVFFLPVFLFYFKKYYLKHKKWVIYGLLTFGVVLLPHIVTVFSGAFAARLDQVSSSSDSSFLVEFVKHFVSYFSPKYLFSDAGSGLARVSPGLGVFYNWFFVAFLVGLYFFGKIIDKKFTGLLGILAIIFLIPVSLTGDVFYPLRALEFLWLVGLVVSIGIIEIGRLIKQKKAKWAIFLVLVFYSLASFYVSYFVLFQHETTEAAGNTYIALSDKLKEYEEYKIVLDSTRDLATGLRIAYFREYDSNKLHILLQNQMATPYYNIYVNNQETYIVDNIEARPINWKGDRCREETILIGDSLTFSETQINEHNLEKTFEIRGINKNVVLTGYKTNPDEKCVPKL